MGEKLTEIKTKIDPKLLPEIIAIEASKVSDAIRVEFGFDAEYLLRAAQHHEIDLNGNELVAFKT